MAGVEDRRDAFELAVGVLNRREHTTAELVKWLAERGIERTEVETAVARLVELGELDDQRFACRYAEDKRELRGWGAERIREVLLARGVDRDQVERALAAESDADQVARAAGLLVRRAEVLADERARARALAYLARRGYGSEIAYEAIRRLERAAA